MRAIGKLGTMRALEEKIAHLERVTQDLSDLVHAQEKKIYQLNRRVASLMDREAERASEGAAVFADKPPPHY